MVASHHYLDFVEPKAQTVLGVRCRRPHLIGKSGDPNLRNSRLRLTILLSLTVTYGGAAARARCQRRS